MKFQWHKSPLGWAPTWTAYILCKSASFNAMFDITFIADIVLTKMVILVDQGMSYQLSSAKSINYMKKRSHTNVHKNQTFDRNSTLLTTYFIDLQIEFTWCLHPTAHKYNWHVYILVVHHPMDTSNTFLSMEWQFYLGDTWWLHWLSLMVLIPLEY